MSTKRTATGKYEMTSQGHTWAIERWVADERYWIGYCNELVDTCIEPQETKRMIVTMIENLPADHGSF